MAGAQARLIAFAQDEVTKATLTQAFEASGIPRALVRGGGVEAALQDLQSGARPDVLVVDLGESETAVFDMGALAAAAGEKIAILALGQVNDIDFYRDMLAAGAAEYLLKPVTAERVLAAILDKLTARDAAKAGAGAEARILSVIGARGGLGATSLAAGLAWILAEERGRKAALVDLDLQFGSVPLTFDIGPGRGLREALEQPNRIDSLFIERAAEKVGANLLILGGEEPLEDNLLVDEGAASALLKSLREKCEWILLDLPRALGPLQRRLILDSTHMVILVEASLVGIRDALRLQTLLRDSAAGAQTIFVAAARPQAKAQNISLKDLEKSLGQPVAIALPWDIDAQARAAAAGKAVPEAAAASKLAGAMRGLADLVAGAEARPKSLIGKLFRKG